MIGKVSTKALNAALRRLSTEVVDSSSDSEGAVTPITRADKLAALLWDKALGGTTQVRDDSGNLKTVVQKPESWAMQYVFERLEGKSTPATPDNETGVRAADKVRALAKDRLNRLATAVVGPPKHVAKKK